jgi:hypothetical protein
MDLRNAGILLLSVATACLAGCITVPPAPVASIKTPIAAQSTQDARSFLFTDVLTRIPLGDRVLNIQHGWLCAPGNSVEWRGGRLNISRDEMSDSFRQEFVKMNYRVAGDPQALFIDESIQHSDLLVAGAIEKLETNVCFPFSGSPNADFGYLGKLKGSTYIRIRWQIYGRLESKVLFEVTTEGSFTTEEVITSSVQKFWKQAFTMNVQNLLGEPAIRELSMRQVSKTPL